MQPIQMVGNTPKTVPRTPEIKAPIGIEPQTMNLMEAFIRPSRCSGQSLCLAVT